MVVKQLHPDERAAPGKSLRKQVPRGSQGAWTPAYERPDPIALLKAQDKNRLGHLIPIKYRRMLESPFAFLRGSALTVLCGMKGISLQLFIVLAVISYLVRNWLIFIFSSGVV